MGKTVALRVTHDERAAFFKRREERSVGEEFADRRAARFCRMRPVAPPLAEPEPPPFEAGFSPLGRSLERGGR